MPSTATTSMLAATLDYRGPQVIDQVFDSHPLSAWLRENKRVKVWEGGGENIEVNIRTDNNDSFAARDYKTQLQFKEQDPIQTVEIGRRFINGHIMWYNAQEEANVGKFRIFDFVNELTDAGKDSMADATALQFWQGGAGETLHGIPAIVSATNTYMTILRTTAGNEYWKAKTGAAFTLTRPNGQTETYGPYNSDEPLVIQGGADGGVDRLYDDCCANGGTDGPDFGICSPLMYRTLKALVRADLIRTNQRLAEIGFPENFTYKNATIVWDRNCGAAAGTPDTSTFFFLNSKYLSLRPYMGYEKLYQTPVLDLQPQGILGKSVIIQWCGNLVCTKPQRCGALTAKTA